nr:hypothetical protein CFP56_53452 [Quercus suber]POF25862.1 hypothetical protein CFP56_77983 [Quercus suber]
MNLFGKENVANDGTNDDSDSDEADGEDKEVFKVAKILAICYSESYFKVCQKVSKWFSRTLRIGLSHWHELSSLDGDDGGRCIWASSIRHACFLMGSYSTENKPQFRVHTRDVVAKEVFR